MDERNPPERDDYSPFSVDAHHVLLVQHFTVDKVLLFTFLETLEVVERSEDDLLLVEHFVFLWNVQD